MIWDRIGIVSGALCAMHDENGGLYLTPGSQVIAFAREGTAEAEGYDLVACGVNIAVSGEVLPEGEP